MAAKRMKRIAFVLVAVLVEFAAGARAQSFKATVIGTVVDSSGAVVPGAAVSIAQDGTGLTAAATSGRDGTFALPQLFHGGVITGTISGRLLELPPIDCTAPDHQIKFARPSIDF